MKASMTSPGARSGSSEMPSFEIPTGAAWKDYRQALRDLPQNHDEANDAADAWPVMPDA